MEYTNFINLKYLGCSAQVQLGRYKAMMVYKFVDSMVHVYNCLRPYLQYNLSI